MEETFDLPQVTMFDRSRSGWLWPVLGLSFALSFPYFFSLETFFSHDDFAILWFHKDWPVWQAWRFFDPDVLTFYRPMQSWTMALLWHFFGMNPFPYSLVLVLIHSANIILFGRLVDRLFEDRPLTFLAVIFYATNWEYCDVVFWKGNYGTALSWLFSLACANVFVAFLQGRRWATYAGSMGFFALALLSKETAVNLPLLLGLVWWFAPARAEFDAEDPALGSAGAKGRRAPAREFVRLLAPFGVLACAYLIFYKLCVRDVYDWLIKGYEVQHPLDAAVAVLKALTFWLVPFVPASEPIAGRLSGRAMFWLLERLFFVLPAALAAIIVFGKSRRLLFGVLWAIFAFLPANLIADYHTPRYYYGSIMGASIVLAELLLLADLAARRRWSGKALASWRLAGSLLILAFVFMGMFYTAIFVNQDARLARDIEDTYRFLVTQRGRVPPNTLFRVHCLNQDHFHYGMGLREMCKLALEDDSIEAILNNQGSLSPNALMILQRDYWRPIELQRIDGIFRMSVAKPGADGRP